MKRASLLFSLAIATTATTAYAEPRRTLNLSVRGSLDGDSLAQAIATELDVVVAIADGTCAVPCLDVAVDGKRVATLTYAPRTGSSRQRTMKLGTNTSQWPLVLTLLAGNLVRDEARDVLGALPPRRLPRPPLQAVAEPPPPPEAEPLLEDVEPAEPPPEVVGDLVAPPAPIVPVVVVPVVQVPVPPPPPPVAVAEPVRPHRTFSLGFVPVLSTDLTQVGSVRHFVSVDLLVGVSGGSSGLTMSGIADIERGPVSGFQIGGITAMASRVSGTQISGIASISAGDVDGVQISGITSVARNVDGLQIAGIGSVANQVDGIQIAGIAAVSRGRVSHQAAAIASVANGATTQLGGITTVSFADSEFQAAGIVAATRKNAGIQLGGVATASAGDANVQAAGFVAVAKNTANIQLAGVVNYARKVRGLQIAPFNVSREVEGVQIGVVNIGGEAGGFSLGLINIVPGGRYDLETTIDSSRTGALLFRHGGRRWHNVYGIAGHEIDDDVGGRKDNDAWMYGFGFGPSMSFDNTTIDLELMSWQVNYGKKHESDISVLGQLRLTVAQRLGPISIVAGGALNAYITDDPSAPTLLERRSEPQMSDGKPDTSVTVTAWPSAFVGIRI